MKKVDRKKTDYRFADLVGGVVYVQEKPFGWVTADWNCDGDIYDEFGASFICTRDYGFPFGAVQNKVFYTVQEIEEKLNDSDYKFF